MYSCMFSVFSHEHSVCADMPVRCAEACVCVCVSVWRRVAVASLILSSCMCLARRPAAGVRLWHSLPLSLNRCESITCVLSLHKHTHIHTHLRLHVDLPLTLDQSPLCLLPVQNTHHVTFDPPLWEPIHIHSLCQTPESITCWASCLLHRGFIGGPSSSYPVCGTWRKIHTVFTK